MGVRNAESILTPAKQNGRRGDGRQSIWKAIRTGSSLRLQFDQAITAVKTLGG
jgi:hypothetical protein